tara:strand:+ start:782 stop:1966 length:1185 start_codon:yes stop_codon:yes gene_type:complete
MRRSASEIISNLERRVAKLEKQATQSGSISIRHKELPYESPRGVLKKYTDDYDKVTAYYGFGPHWDERYTFKGLSEREEKRLLKDVKSLPQVGEVAMFVEDDSEKGYRNITASSKNLIAVVNRDEYSTAKKFKSHIKDRNTFVGVLVCGLKKLGNRKSHKILGVLGGNNPFKDKVIVAKCKLLLKGVKDIPGFIRVLAQINIDRRFLKNEQFEFLVQTYLGNFLKFYDVTVPQDCIELMYPGTSMNINDFNTWVEDVDEIEEDSTEINSEDMDDSFSYEYGDESGVHGGKFTRITYKITRELTFDLITNQDSRELDLPKEYARVAFDTLEDYFEKNQDKILDQFFLSKNVWEYGDEELVDASLGLYELNDNQIELTVTIETTSENDVVPDPYDY